MSKAQRFPITASVIARTSIIGALGGAFCGFAPLFVPYAFSGDHSFGSIIGSAEFGALGAAFGAPFGLVVFPLCYLTLVRFVPMGDVLLYAIPATIVGEIVFGSGVWGWSPQVDLVSILYMGGFAGLLITCLILRIAKRPVTAER